MTTLLPDAEPPTYSYGKIIENELVCDRCGVVVDDLDTHTAYHLSLTEAIHAICDSIVAVAPPEVQALLKIARTS